MNAASPGSQREFLLKQIENEIDAGFTLVAAARRAYASRQPGEGDDALANALGAHQEALKHMSDSELGQMRAIVHQLEELRGAIDWLSESHLERRSHASNINWHETAGESGICDRAFGLGRHLKLELGGLSRQLSETEQLPEISVYGITQVSVIDQELAGIFAALPDSLAFVAIPGAALFDEAFFSAEIENVAMARDAMTIEDVDLHFAEGSRNLVLYDFHFGAVFRSLPHHL